MLEQDTMMKKYDEKARVIKPAYYDNFICIAERCSFTCCQEWKIVVDDSTAKKWKSISIPKSLQTKNKKLSYFTTCKDNSRVIALNREHQCPFLNKEKLCELVTTYGDDILSETCSIFPREVHAYDDRKELTLMPSCPAVVDLLREQETFSLMESKALIPESETDTNTQIRSFFIDIMNRKDISPEMSLLMIFYLALDLLEKEPLTHEKFAEYKQSGILPELQKTIEHMEFDNQATFEERNELFLDLIENYRKEGMYTAYLNEIADWAEQYLEGYGTQITESKLQTFRNEWKNHESLFRNLLCEELFADLLLPGEGLQHIVVKLQWLAMEYAVIYQCLFLKWDKTRTLTYEDVRNYIVVLFRMTGYDEEDIYEYLENSFASLIWDWGYFALITN